MTAILLALALAFAADPAPAELPAPPDAAPSAFDASLEIARTAWFQGDVDTAREAFQALYAQLLAGVDVPLDRAGEVAIYTGEIAYEGGDIAAAEAAWSWLLHRDPDHPISPYHHPIEVIGLFESVRSRVKAELAALPAPRPPRYPAWGWLPLGVPQYQQRQPVAGTVFLVAQAALGTASMALWLDLNARNPELGEDTPKGVPDGDALAARNLANKYRYQWPATFGFYSMWAISTTAGQTRWRNQHPAGRPSVLLYPGAAPAPQRLPTVPMVVVSGRF